MTELQPVRRRPRSRRGEGRKLATEILDAAADLVEETGSETGVTLKGIARRVGISAPSIYDHFDDLHAVRQAMVNQSFRLFADQVITALHDGETPQQRLARFLAAYLAFGRAQPATYRLLFTRVQPSAVAEAGQAAFTLIATLLDLMAAATGLPRDSPELLERGVFLWIDVHGLVSLPPSHPRFPWPDEQHLLNAALRRAGIA